MPTLVEEHSQRARTLSAEDRGRLVDDLLASREEPADPGAEAAWEAEIAQRVDEIKSGQAKLVPADEVFAETARIYRK